MPEDMVESPGLLEPRRDKNPAASSCQWGDTGQRRGAAMVPITSLISGGLCLHSEMKGGGARIRSRSPLPCSEELVQGLRLCRFRDQFRRDALPSRCQYEARLPWSPMKGRRGASGVRVVPGCPDGSRSVGRPDLYTEAGSFQRDGISAVRTNFYRVSPFWAWV